MLAVIEPNLLLGGMGNLSSIAVSLIPRLAVVSCVTKFEYQRHLLASPFAVARAMRLDRIPVHHLGGDIDDAPDADIAPHLTAAAEFIEQMMQSKNDKGEERIVVVHCAAGKSRSATLVIFFLMLKRKMSLQQAAEAVKRARPYVMPNSGFLTQLIELDKKMRGDEAAAAGGSFPNWTAFESHMIQYGASLLQKGGDNGEAYLRGLKNAAKPFLEPIPGGDDDKVDRDEILGDISRFNPTAGGPGADDAYWLPPVVQVGIEDFFEMSVDKFLPPAEKEEEDRKQQQQPKKKSGLRSLSRSKLRRLYLRAFLGEDLGLPEEEVSEEEQQCQEDQAASKLPQQSKEDTEKAMLERYKQMVASVELDVAEGRIGQHAGGDDDNDDWEKALEVEDEDAFGAIARDDDSSDDDDE